MSLNSSLNRRTFLKLGAAGSAAAALSPSLVASANSVRSLSCPPSLSDLASDRLTYRLRDLFNCPVAMNEWGYAQVGKSVSAITAVSFPPYACCGVPDTAWSPGFLLTCEIFLDGRFLAITAAPDGNVEYQWFPHCVVRKQTAGNLRFTTRLFLPSQHRAVVQAISTKNISKMQRRFSLAFNIQGVVAQKTTPWSVNSPGEADNHITWDAKRGCLLFEAQHSKIAAAQGFQPAPSRVEQSRMLYFEMELNPGEEKELNFVLTIADEGRAALDLYDNLQAGFARLEKDNEAAFNSLVQAAFTPGNSSFSGNLPRLVTNDESLWKLYHNGFANLLFARRHSPDSAYGPTYLTLSGHVLPTLSFPWDTSLTSLAMALLDPIPLRNLVEVWLRSDMHQHHSTDYVTGEPVGPWYAVNDAAIVRCAWRYLCVTGDLGWLDKRVGDRTVLDCLDDHALYWKRLDRFGHGLADYGTIENLLEVVSTYLHEVAGMNAGNVHSMRVLADLHERRGNSERAKRLRREAQELAERINRLLYIKGKGYWRCGQPDGTFNEVRHCYDFLAVLDNMSEDLAPAQKQEMNAFFWRELHSEKWMRALAQDDADATWNIRPDHSCLGAYAAWPPMTAKGLYKIDSPDKIAHWLREVAKAGNQGPIGQGHFVEDVYPPVNGGAFKSSEDAPFIEDWCCIAAGAFTELVIDSIFGAELTLGDGIKVNSHLHSFDPKARLEGVRYQGSLYTITKTGAQREKA
ncbi:MAG TPA: twin-arginine translocation signal domain-containing protein [Terriglobales bacterium]|nr:twin-arginine translocation signal domain-containing protein [Terriglobales bacterium]